MCIYIYIYMSLTLSLSLYIYIYIERDILICMYRSGGATRISAGSGGAAPATAAGPAEFPASVHL